MWPQADDVLVQRLRAAGAIIVGKSTTPEFGVKGLTDGPSFGVTRNPWNLERTPGGSSGGGAAAVAAGLGPLALGTDGAGSVRGPASCSGLVGLKPTLGAVPADTSRDAFGNNVYAGPLARTITDAAIMHSVLVGPSDKDPWTLAGGGQRPLSPKLSGEDLSGVRIGYIELTANPRIAADVRANTRSALAAWQEMGAAVEEVTEKIDWIEYEGRVLYQANFAVFCAQYLPKWQNQMDPVTLAFMERGAKFTLADFRNAQFARTALVPQDPVPARALRFPGDADQLAHRARRDARRGQRRGPGRRREVRHHPPGLDVLPVPFQPHRPSRARAALGLRRRRPADVGPDRRQMGRRDRRAAAGRAAGAGAAMGAASAAGAVALSGQYAKVAAGNSDFIGRNNMRFKTALLGLLAVLAVTGPAAAEFPDKPIRIMAPYAPGGNIDVTARIIADKLKDMLGVTVLVENKAGASGMIGGDVIARSAPDGYNLLVAANSLVVVPVIYGNAPYDWKTAFQPISHIQAVPAVIVVHPSSPIKTLADFIRIGRETPGKLAVADSGIGTTNQIVIELLSDATGAKYTLVHYKGSGAASIDVIAGQVPAQVDQLNSVDRPHQGGQAARHCRHVRQARAGTSRRADR